MGGLVSSGHYTAVKIIFSRQIGSLSWILLLEDKNKVNKNEFD
jgi:hypothetical protein